MPVLLHIPTDGFTTDLSERLRITRQEFKKAQIGFGETTSSMCATRKCSQGKWVVICFGLIPMTPWAHQHASEHPQHKVFIVTGSDKAGLIAKTAPNPIPGNLEVWTVPDESITSKQLQSRMSELANYVKQFQD